jgi:hypothetical protein
MLVSEHGNWNDRKQKTCESKEPDQIILKIQVRVKNCMNSCNCSDVLRSWGGQFVELQQLAIGLSEKIERN